MYIALGRFHAGQTEEAIEPFRQSAALAGEAGDKSLQTRALNAAGVLLEEAGQLDDALYFFNQSLNLAQDLKDRPNEATALRNIGRHATRCMTLAHSASDTVHGWGRTPRCSRR